jgi:hypothetical protein
MFTLLFASWQACPSPGQCDGLSLVSQLKSPGAKRDRLALCSFQFGNERNPSHGVSDERYRFIRYGNGFEELYDLKNDPHEFENLIENPQFSSVKTRLAKGIPTNPVTLAILP